MQRDMREAMKGQDRLTVSVLRTALAAVDNAGAVDAGWQPYALVGVTDDVPRRELDETAVRAVLMRELEERREALTELPLDNAYRDRLSAEIEVLDRYLVP